jgi:pyruvate/2-oxoglutarate dehydrogenase complex dihydrolipoamide acyltransferase (E2) component
MAREIVMPQLNLSMDKGQIVNWLKQTGDRVLAGDILLEVESDKAVAGVEAVGSGILQILLGPESGEIPVGTVIAYLLEENEPLPEQPAVFSTVLPMMPAVTASVSSTSLSASTPTGRRLPSSPAARRKAAEL